MWMVELEYDWNGHPMMQVIIINTIAHAAHLLSIYGSSRVSDISTIMKHWTSIDLSLSIILSIIMHMSLLQPTSYMKYVALILLRV
jgi:hypothetical protein